MFLLLAIALVATPVSRALANNADEPQAEDPVLVSSLRIITGNVFGPDQAAGRLAYRFTNSLHSTTRRATIEREIGVRPGQRISRARLLEIERNLRRSGLFASVNAELAEVDGGYELVITTRDQLSLISSASGSFVGGVGQVGFALGERNLLGTGNSLTVSYAGNSAGSNRGEIAFRDWHFLRPEWRAGLRVGRTEEGDFLAASMSRPYKSDSQPQSWSLSMLDQGTEIDYFDSGSSVIQVPRDVATFGYSRERRSFSAAGRNSLGWVLRYTDSDYGEVAGRDAALITVPPDNRLLFSGLRLGRDRNLRFARLRGLDTLNFVQDLRLGLSTDLLVGVNWLDEAGATAVLEPTMQLGLRYARQIARKSWLSTHLQLSASDTKRLTDEQRDAWSASFAARLFYTRFRHQTIALNIDYAIGEAPGSLPVQFTLGENNGLRGYPARQFSGRKRLRLNVENRMFRGRRVGPLDIGAVVFADAGWLGDFNRSLSRVGSSVGVGLRIGSNALLGGAVFRIDLAAPLDAINSESHPRDPVISMALGQVFGATP